MTEGENMIKRRYINREDMIIAWGDVIKVRENVIIVRKK